MTIREINNQFEIQGAFVIRKSFSDTCWGGTLEVGSEYEYDKWNFDEEVLDKKIIHMYAIENVQYIVVE